MSQPSRAAALVSLGLMELVRSGIWLAFIPFGAGGAGEQAGLIGLALSTHYGTETALKLVAGWLVDLLGARRILPLSLAAATGAAALLVLWPASPYALIGGAVLLGLCTAPAWLAVIQAVAPPSEASGGKMGSIWLAWMAGMGGGPVLTGVALEYLPGPLVALLLVAAMGLAALAVTLFPAPARAVSRESTRPLAALRDQWRDLAPLAPALIGQTLLAGMMAPVLPQVARDLAGLTPAQYSLALSAGGVACLAGMLPGGWLADRLGGRRVLVGGFVAMGSMLGLMAVALLSGGSIPKAVGPVGSFASVSLAVGGGLAYALILPAWTSTVGRAVPADAVGTGWGLISTLEGAGLAIGPVLGGSLWSLGPTAMLAAVGLTLILLGLYYRVAPLPGQAPVRPGDEEGAPCRNG